MIGIKQLLCALVALVAVSAVQASAASAEACPPATGSGHVAVCVSEVVLAKGATQEFAGEKKAGTTSKLEVTGGPTVVCGMSTATGLLEGGGTAVELNAKEEKTGVSGSGKEVVLSFSGCEVTNTPETKANCEVPPITTKAVKGTFTGEEAKKVTFTPETGTEFATVVIKNKEAKACTFKTAGSKVAGTQVCGLPKALEELATQELKCETSGSTLKYGATENAAVFELSGEFWLGTATSLTGKKFSAKPL